MTTYNNRESGWSTSRQHMPDSPTLASRHEQADTPVGGVAYNASLFGVPSLNGSANTPARTSLVSGMQRTYGNRAVQRYVQRNTQARPAVAVQRFTFMPPRGRPRPQLANKFEDLPDNLFRRNIDEDDAIYKSMAALLSWGKDKLGGAADSLADNLSLLW